MGKLLQFKPRRTGLTLLSRAYARPCPECGHRLAIHIVRPNGVLECGIRPCPCRMHRGNR